MHRLKVLNQMRKVVFIPVPVVAGTVTAATIATISATKVVLAANPPPPPPPPPPPEDCDPNKPLVRAKDLPLYYDPDSKLVKHKECKEVEEKFPDDKLMSIVQWCRLQVENVKFKFGEVKEKSWSIVETGQSHAQTTLTQLRESEDPKPRYGVIGAGAFIGLLFSLRGGVFKKIIYTSTGAAVAAAICFPDEAEVYTSEVYELYQELSSIAYHFTQAAIKDLTGSELSIPEFVKVNPVETVKVWIGKTSDSENVSKSSPSSATLLPPVAETPSHVISATQSSVPSSKPGIIPMPPLENPSKSESIKLKR